MEYSSHINVLTYANPDYFVHIYEPLYILDTGFESPCHYFCYSFQPRPNWVNICISVYTTLSGQKKVQVYSQYKFAPFTVELISLFFSLIYLHDKLKWFKIERCTCSPTKIKNYFNFSSNFGRKSQNFVLKLILHKFQLLISKK